MAASSEAGVLPVDKPPGPTSHDVVDAARRALRIRRIGHTGTLDPFASGLLLLCVGAATRIAEYLTGLGKTYRAVIRLGEATDTDDRTGRVLERSEQWRSLDSARIRAALEQLRGEQDQTPPLYSAKKVGGVRMHRLARAGAAPARTPVRVRIDDIRVLRVDLPDVTVDVDCSAGTYVRAIARDVGILLGCFAHLAELRRTHIGRHDVRAALRLDELADAAAVGRALISPLAALDHLPIIRVDAAAAGFILHGQSIEAPADLPDATAIVIAHGDRLLAIAEPAGGELKPRKVFVDE